MRQIADTAKEFFIPGSFSFLVIGLFIGVACLYIRKTARWGRAWLTLLAIGYWTLAIPITANWMASGLYRGYRPLEKADDAGGAKTVVVLTGGSRTYRGSGGQLNLPLQASALRALEAARVYHLLGGATVLVSGGTPDSESAAPESEAVADALVKAGVPRDRIELESQSRNTREEVIHSVPLLKAKGVAHFVLVTSPEHMWRALGAFAREGLHPVPSVSERLIATTGIWSGIWWKLMPTRSALEISAIAIREYVALLYYWARGWFTFPASGSDRA